ncbi:MAG: hypothetical protein U5L95_02595 [Candidatus Saccharibacteria bacterium]|nr:hypothetical protein [Candidatus Saccharibacteria bacterium]
MAAIPQTLYWQGILDKTLGDNFDAAVKEREEWYSDDDSSNN